MLVTFNCMAHRGFEITKHYAAFNGRWRKSDANQINRTDALHSTSGNSELQMEGEG